MKKNNLKRLLAAAMAATTLLGTALPTMADTVAYPNLTACPNPYTGEDQKFTQMFTLNGKEQSDAFSVWGATSDWLSVGYLSAEEAADVTWDVLAGSTAGVSVDGGAYQTLEDENLWFSMGMVTVDAAAEPGLAVVEAKNSQGGYTDFTVIVNSNETVAPVTGIRNVFYDASGTTETPLLDLTCASVSGNGFYGYSNYPSPLDCFSSLMTIDAEKKVDAYYGKLSDYNSYILDYVTIDGETYTSSMSWDGASWQYRVYDGTSKQMKDFSEIVGMDDFQLEDDDIVVWKYGTYNVEFPKTFTE